MISGSGVTISSSSATAGDSGKDSEESKLKKRSTSGLWESSGSGAVRNDCVGSGAIVDEDRKAKRSDTTMDVFFHGMNSSTGTDVVERILSFWKSVDVEDGKLVVLLASSDF